MNEVTRLLERIHDGDGDAADQLGPLVYDHLHGMARAMFRAEGGHTLQPTALVHEAWIKLAGSMSRFECRRHFYAVAAKAMRQVLADHARDKRRQKRGGGVPRVTLRDSDGEQQREVDLVALNDSLEHLERLNARHARVVELRLFGALTLAETAQTLGISQTTAHSDWNMARAWLRSELRAG